MKNLRIFSRLLLAMALVTSVGVSSLVAMNNGSDVKPRDIHPKKRLQQQKADSVYIKHVIKNVDLELKQTAQKAEQGNKQKENKQPKALDIKPLDILEVVTLSREVNARLDAVKKHFVNLNALLELAKKVAPGQLKIWSNNSMKVGKKESLKKKDEKSILELLAQINDFFVKDASVLVGYFGQKTITHWFGLLPNQQRPEYRSIEGATEGVNGALYAIYEALRGKSSDEIVATINGFIFLEASLNKLNEFKNQETGMVEKTNVIEQDFAAKSKGFAVLSYEENKKQKEELEQGFANLLSQFFELDKALALCVGPRGLALQQTLASISANIMTKTAQ